MSLHEVMRGSETIEAKTYSILETKKRESAELEKDVQEFIAKGGKPKQIPIGIIAASSYVPSEFGAGNTAEHRDRVRENSRKKCIKASMDAKLFPTAQDDIYHSDANKDKFVVIVGEHISRQFDYIHQAVSYRDYYFRRMKNGANN